MIKKIVSIFMVVCMVLTVCTAIVSADESIAISSKLPTKIIPSQSAEYYFASYPTEPPFYSNYTPLNSSDTLRFVLSVSEDGLYDINMFAARYAQKDLYLTVQVDNEPSKKVYIPASSGYYDFSKTISVGTFNLVAGIHTLNVSGATGGLHLNSFEIIKRVNPDEVNNFSKTNGTYVGPYANITLPAVINGEKFDIGDGAYHSVDNVNLRGEYRKDEPMDIFAKGTDASDYYLALDFEEYAKYTFNVSESAVYTMSLVLGGSAEMSVYIDDAKYPLIYEVGEKTFGNTEPVDIYLEKGTHVLKIECTEYKYNSDETLAKVDEIVFNISQTDVKDSIKISDLNNTGYMVRTDKTFDYDKLDKENKIYKELYISPDGNDLQNGSKEAPFKSLERAAEELSKITDSMTGDIIVNIASGYYELDETLKLKNEHGGKNGYNVIFRGEAKDKPVISGGQKVTGWEKHDEHLWKAKVSDVDVIRNLYVNDYPAARARSKYLYTYDADHYTDSSPLAKSSGFIASGLNFPRLSNPEDVETGWRFSWQLTIHPVQDIIYRDDGTVAFVMDEPSWNSMFSSRTASSAPKVGARFYLENAMELLTDPGEFYYNKKEQTIYYYPYSEQNMETAETYIGKTEFMVDVRGNDQYDRVTNIVFENLEFKYGKWDEVSKYGVGGVQTDRIYDVANTGDGKGGRTKMGTPAQFAVNNAENVVIKDCIFACLGSSALFFTDAVKNVKIDGNIIRDVSGSAISIGAFYHANDYAVYKNKETTNCENFMVSNNVIRRTGNEYSFQAAVSTFYDANINIVHNDISMTPYTGISAGWGWGSSTMRSDLHMNVQIKNNRISNTMQYMIDGAPLYTLGDLSGGEISENYLYGPTMYGNYNQGIYSDEGTSNVAVHDNVVEVDRGNWLYVQHTSYGNENSRYYNNYTNKSDWSNVPDAASNITVEEPVVIREGAYPEKVLDIIENAGVGDEYKELLKKSELPEWMVWRVHTNPNLEFLSSKVFEPTFGWIQAENYIPGENGETYYDTVDGWYNNTYRSEGVSLLELKPNVGEVDGYVIDNCAKGEWISYRAFVPEDGEYTFKVHYGHGSSTPEKFNLYIDGELVINAGELKKGAKGWNEILTASFNGIKLSAGEHTLKYMYAGGGHYLDKLGLFYSDGEEVVNEETASEDYDEISLVTEENIKSVKSLSKVNVFRDIYGHFAEKDIKFMHLNKIVNGIDENTFAPNQLLTREQAIWLCLRAAGINYNESDWVNVALENEIIGKAGNGKEVISREEFANVLMNTYKHLNPKYSVTYGDDYEDVNSISEEYYIDVLSARDAGLLKGDTNGCFRPKDGLTRAEAVVSIRRLMGI